MASVVAGIDPHQDNFTVGIVDSVGVEITWAKFDNNAPGDVAAIELLTNHEVSQVGIEGSASWGAHVAIALVAAGFDAREVPPQRTAQQRRSRRHDKTDNTDAIATRSGGARRAHARSGANAGGVRLVGGEDRGGA